MAAMPSTENSLGSILEQVAKEKGIEKKILVETIEAAILNVLEAGLNSLLVKILRVHWKQIEQLKILARGCCRTRVRLPRIFQPMTVPISVMMRKIPPSRLRRVSTP